MFPGRLLYTNNVRQKNTLFFRSSLFKEPPLDDPSETLGDVCINCMRCVQVCPQQCRALPAPFVAGATQMLNEKAAGYKKPVVFL